MSVNVLFYIYCLLPGSFINMSFLRNFLLTENLHDSSSKKFSTWTDYHSGKLQTVLWLWCISDNNSTLKHSQGKYFWNDCFKSRRLAPYKSTLHTVFQALSTFFITTVWTDLERKLKCETSNSYSVWRPLYRFPIRIQMKCWSALLLPNMAMLSL